MTLAESYSILWFRRDLRITDNPALKSALSHKKVFFLYIHAPDEESPWQLGGASKWWLHHSLLSLDRSLRELGSGLILLEGESKKTLLKFAKKNKVSNVYWSRIYDPSVISRDKKIKQSLIDSGLEAKSVNSSLLTEPWEIKTGGGTSYKVYTPYSKAVFKIFEPKKSISKPKQIKENSFLKTHNFEKTLKSFKLLPKVNWDKEFYQSWQPGEQGALKVLKSFTADSDRNYSDNRDIPSLPGTSLLSPHLHFGEISPSQIFRAIRKSNISEPEKFAYLRQIVWRDFSHSLLFNFPNTPLKPLREEYEKFPWKKNKKMLTAWQQGKTGYPIVDAGMKELWVTGWMHNRVRMVAASLLVKHLLQPWQEGAKWFWDTLVDADLANNTMGWQWVAGSGADAAPYFRVFNPVRQGERFDKDGEYVKKWLPELKDLPSKWIHCPWEASEEVLRRANIRLGKDYPLPIIDVAEGRDRALDAYSSFKEQSSRP